MVLPVINYAAMEPQGNPLWRGMAPAITQGLNTAMDLRQGKNTLKTQDLANALSKIKLEYAPDMMAAELKQQQMLANIPFGGLSLPGTSGEILALERMKIMFGENSPQYQNAARAFQLSQAGDVSRINYQNMLAQTLPDRILTPEGKAAIEETRVGVGLSPSGFSYNQQAMPKGPNQPLQNMQQLPVPNNMQEGYGPPGFNQEMQAQQGMPQQGQMPNFQQYAPPAQELANQYALRRQKGSTDEGTRQKNLYANNIEKAFNNINPEDLTRYAGAIGTLESTKQGYLSSFGKESKEYKKYQNALTGTQALAKQIRQFYGDSIQPEVLEKIENLVNPAVWKSNPELAKSNFFTLKTILDQEMETYRDAMKSPKVYTETNPYAFSDQQQRSLLNAGVAKAVSTKQDPMALGGFLE